MPPGVEHGMWSSLRWLRQIGEATTSFAAAVALVGFAGWWLLGDKVEETTRDLAGTEELLAKIVESEQEARERGNEVLAEVGEVRAEQVIQGRTLLELTDRVDSLEPISSVAEYDALRSKIKNPCRLGEPCNWTIRARRTAFGDTCDGPPVAVSRHFVDAAGNEYIVPNGNDNRVASRIGTDWTIIQGAFMLPEIAATGVGEFYMDIHYRGCGDSDSRITEETIYLQVEVVE